MTGSANLEKQPPLGFHASANPEAYDTRYHFEYVSKEAFESGGYANPATRSTPPKDIGSISHGIRYKQEYLGLSPGTVYHWRIVTENSKGTTYGPDETFESLPAVSIRNFTTQTVGPELVKIKAELNPNGQPTHLYGPLRRRKQLCRRRLRRRNSGR